MRLLPYPALPYPTPSYRTLPRTTIPYPSPTPSSHSPLFFLAGTAALPGLSTVFIEYKQRTDLPYQALGLSRKRLANTR